MDFDQIISTRDVELIRLFIQWPATTVGYLYQKSNIPSKIQGTDLVVPVLSQSNPLISAVAARMTGSENNDDDLSVIPLMKDLNLLITPTTTYRVRSFPVTIPTTLLAGDDDSTVVTLSSDRFTNNQMINAALHYLSNQVKLLALPPPILYSSIIPELPGGIQITPILTTDLGLLSQFLVELGRPWGVTHDVSVGDYYSSSVLIDPELLRSLIVQLTCQLDQLHQLVGFRGGGLLASGITIQNQPLEADYRGVQITSPLTCHIVDLSRARVTLAVNGRKAILEWNDHLTKVKTFRMGSETLPNSYNVDYRTNSRHGSWDYYTLLCSMLLVPSIHYRWFSDPDLIQDLWVPLWENQKQAEDVQRVLHAALRDDRPPTLETITCLLQPYLLKDDIVQQQLLKWMPYGIE